MALHIDKASGKDPCQNALPILLVDVVQECFLPGKPDRQVKRRREAHFTDQTTPELYGNHMNSVTQRWPRKRPHFVCFELARSGGPDEAFRDASLAVSIRGSDSVHGSRRQGVHDLASGRLALQPPRHHESANTGAFHESSPCAHHSRKALAEGEE